MKFGQNMGVDDPKVNLEGQGHRSKGQGHKVKKRLFRSHSTVLHLIFEVKGHMGQGQKSRWSSSKADFEGQGQRSRSPGQKCGFRSHLTVLQVMFKIKGHRSGSKVTWVKVKGQVG